MNKEQISDWLRGLQDNICTSLEELDGQGVFREDKWDRPGGGGGRARVIQGQVIEKGGVNFSAVHGQLPAKIAAALQLDAGEFYATGVSIVLHPKSPEIPIIHMNVRYFEVTGGKWWFGGGIDVTPHYVQPDDARFFHQYLKDTCDHFDESFYPKFKVWADDYFYIKHRKETRGIGGIFYDRLSNQNGFTKEQRFEFMQAVGTAFVPIYKELVARNINKSYSEEEEKWQKIRRGRYVEFNLVWDKGTKFGLDTDGRTESILMSLPPLAGWEYAHVPAAGSREAETLDLLKKGINWVGK